MPGRVVRLADKTTVAPYYAETALFHRVDRFHSVDFVDIVAVTSGNGIETLYRGDAEPIRRSLGAGRMVLYRPGDDVMISTSTGEGMVVCYISFPAGEWASFASIVGVDPSWAIGLPPVADFDVDDPVVRRPFDSVIERYQAEPTPIDLARFWIEIIPSMFPSSYRRFPGTGAPTWLRDGVESMREESNLVGGVRRLLALTHVSASHLSATTRRHYDKTPSELVLEIRLRHAALLLSTTAETVGRISERCGFASFPHFSSVFRRAYRVTPREYRARSAAKFGTARR